ncbi:osmoprotectant transport system permease protein [Pseudonocardia hierapolitana]|uniref:Osmoprotectant transport system permease protein n=1 Tax=Pseudonocardia hierapolitana TaxID=1128676 RepID=A0A561SUX5_9PSEU|nr:ABC transporter permease [Pseudonocardia hierapolitana]TWF78652.1 osmoprotectant transport system permease protein [Pseudonocardia hierapolitana]
MIWSWIPGNADRILALTVEHLRLALIPVVVGLVLSVPLGWLANRYPLARAVLVPAAGVLYTIPSLTLFVVLPGILGTRILSEINIIVALTIYTVALLVRTIADALAAVPGLVVAAATAMGYRPARRFLDVELPLAIPVLIAGLRVATVSSISLVSVGALIGVGGLGEFFTEGFQLQFPTEIIVGVALTVLLALAGDAVLLVIGRILTPWNRQRAGGAR